MKTIILFIFITSFSVAQNSETYKNGKIKKGVSKIEHFLEPLGKNVTVTFDDFFKAYIISYVDISGFRKEIKFVKSMTSGSIASRIRGIYTYKGIDFDLFQNKDDELNTFSLEFRKRYDSEPLRYYIYDLILE